METYGRQLLIYINRFVGKYLTYKEWKQIPVAVINDLTILVSTLPIRNGNIDTVCGVRFLMVA